jgi:hypothetical protein
MSIKYLLFVLFLFISLFIGACGSESIDVPSLVSTPIPDTMNEELDNEALMMEFAECLRNEGLEVADPKVDADGNVEKPEIIGEDEIPKEEWIEAYEVCGEIIANITFEEKEVDRTTQLEQYLEIATCMSEAGFGVGEPTAETLDTWMADLKDTFDWDDPDAQEVIDSCFGGGSDGGGGK